MGTAPVRRDPADRLAAQARRGATSPVPGSYRVVRNRSEDLPLPVASGAAGVSFGVFLDSRVSALASGAKAEFTTNLFGQGAYTSDFTWDATNKQMLVAADGWYSFGFWVKAGITAGQVALAQLWVDEWESEPWETQLAVTSPGGSSARGFISTPVLPCSAGGGYVICSVVTSSGTWTPSNSRLYCTRIA